MKFSKRQQEIIHAATAIVAEGGMSRLTTKNLAAALGVTEPALYRHFKNKSEIVRGMIEDFDNGFVPPDGLSGFAAIEAFAMARFRQVAERPALAKVLFSEELFFDDPALSAMMLDLMHRHRARLRTAFAEAAAAGEIRGDLEPDMLFRLVFGPVRLLVKQYGLSGFAFDLAAEGRKLMTTLRNVLQ